MRLEKSLIQTTITIIPVAGPNHPTQNRPTQTLKTRHAPPTPKNRKLSPRADSRAVLAIPPNPPSPEGEKPPPQNAKSPEVFSKKRGVPG